jgi:hypothetical protein
MAYKFYDTAQGAFCIDWDTCCHIIRSYHRSELTLANSREERESQVTLVNPLSWGLPDLYMLTVDWDKVRSEATAQVLSSAHGLAFRAVFQKNGVDAMVSELKAMQARTRSNNAAFKDKTQAVSRKAFHEIEKSVAGYQTAVDILKGVRDLSASTLVGLGTAATGGAAALGIGAGAVLKSTAKYQDTEKNAGGVAFVEASQTILTAVVPMGTAAKIVVATVGDTGKALIEGRSVGTALGIGAVNVVTGPLGDKGKKLLGAIFDKVAVGAVVKVGQDALKRFLQKEVKEAGKAAPGPAFTGRASPLMDSLAFEDSLLLKFAVVDPAKGIGQSWW